MCRILTWSQSSDFFTCLLCLSYQSLLLMLLDRAIWISSDSKFCSIHESFLAQINSVNEWHFPKGFFFFNSFSQMFECTLKGQTTGQVHTNNLKAQWAYELCLFYPEVQSREMRMSSLSPRMWETPGCRQGRTPQKSSSISKASSGQASIRVCWESSGRSICSPHHPTSCRTFIRPLLSFNYPLT
jgi:hypothetical protein